MKLTCHGAKARALKLATWLLRFTKVQFKTTVSGLVERWVRGLLYVPLHVYQLKKHIDARLISMKERSVKRETIRRYLRPGSIIVVDPTKPGLNGEKLGRE